MWFKNGSILFSSSNSQQHRSVLENHTVGPIDPNKIYLDAANRGITIFRVDDFLDERQWMKLTHLYLPKNNLLKLPEDLFSILPNLRWFDARWNDLLTIPQSIKEHSSINTLLLQNNNIEVLPLELGSLPKLRCLSVLNNPLEFPSKSVLSELRTHKELINYMRKCWQEQSTEIPLRGKKAIRKRPAKKLTPLRKVKDHTEVICRLRNSGRIKDQVMAQKMLHDLELEQKLVQSFKDQDVLKKWRDKYRNTQGADVTRNRAPRKSLFRRTSESKPQSSQHSLLTRDIDQAISNLSTQLAQCCSFQTSNDPEAMIQRTGQEIEMMSKIKKDISYLKHHC